MPENLGLRTTANRERIADLFDQLDESQLSTPSLCAGWSCRDLLGHVVMSVELSFPRFLVEVARDRGRADATSYRLARQLGARPVPELLARLRERGGAALSPPGVGPGGPFADSCIHLRDAAIPLGLPHTPPVQDWIQVLTFLTTARARVAGFLPRGRLEGLHLSASDHPWTSGDGDPVEGTSEALALALTGRARSLDELSGTGVVRLRRRLLDRSS